MARLTLLVISALAAVARARNAVEDAFVSLLSDDDVLRSTVSLLIDPQKTAKANITSVADQGLAAQRDQEAQVSLLSSFAGDTARLPFAAVKGTDLAIENSFQNIITSPSPPTAQHEARLIASARYFPFRPSVPCCCHSRPSRQPAANISGT